MDSLSASHQHCQQSGGQNDFSEPSTSLPGHPHLQRLVILVLFRFLSLLFQRILVRGSLAPSCLWAFHDLRHLLWLRWDAHTLTAASPRGYKAVWSDRIMDGSHLSTLARTNCSACQPRHLQSTQSHTASHRHVEHLSLLSSVIYFLHHYIPLFPSSSTSIHQARRVLTIIFRTPLSRPRLPSRLQRILPTTLAQGICQSGRSDG